MSNPSLTARDLSLLVALADDPADAAALARRVGDAPADPDDSSESGDASDSADSPDSSDAAGSADAADPDDVRDRLSVLLDNGLARETDDGYALTDSGRRVADAPGGAADPADDSVDAPPEVREALRDRGLDADRRDAVLAAFAFLRYWGTATGAEIADGAFAEVPLEYPTADAWWGFVADHLAAVPTVDAPDPEGGFWRFDGRPGVADLSDDGRKRLFDHGSPGQYASATEAMAAMDLSDDARRAVAAALAALQGNEGVGTETLRAAVDDAGGATGGSADHDAEELIGALERLPGVVREGERWRYTLTPDGYASA